MMAIESLGPTMAVIRSAPTDKITAVPYGSDGAMVQISGFNSAMSAIVYGVTSIQPTALMPTPATGPMTAITVSNHVMNILGNNTGDQVKIDLNWKGQGGVLAQITGPNVAISAVAWGISTVNFLGGNGNDHVSVTESARPTSRMALNLQLGGGKDQVDLGLQAGLLDHRLDVNITGGKGSDQVGLHLGPVTDATLNLTATLRGAGDSFNAWLTGDLTEVSRVNLAVTGGPGNETMSLHAGSIKVGTGSVLQATFTGGAGADNIDFEYQGLLLGQLLLAGDGGAGNDTLTANLTASPGSTGKVNAKLNGGAGDDTLTFNFLDLSGLPVTPGTSHPGVFVPHSRLAGVTLLADGGPGTDTLHATPNVTAVNCEVINPILTPH
jgi:hypothetical protein